VSNENSPNRYLAASLIAFLCTHAAADPPRDQADAVGDLLGPNGLVDLGPRDADQGTAGDRLVWQVPERVVGGFSVKNSARRHDRAFDAKGYIPRSKANLEFGADLFRENGGHPLTLVYLGGVLVATDIKYGIQLLTDPRGTVDLTLKDFKHESRQLIESTKDFLSNPSARLQSAGAKALDTGADGTIAQLTGPFRDADVLIRNAPQLLELSPFGLQVSALPAPIGDTINGTIKATADLVSDCTIAAEAEAQQLAEDLKTRTEEAAKWLANRVPEPSKIIHSVPVVVCPEPVRNEVEKHGSKAIRWVRKTF